MQVRLFAKSFLTYGLYALRGKTLAAILLATGPVLADAPVTVLAFGDSLTQGYGLVQEDGFVPQLAAWLAEEGAEAQLINGGVSGDTTAGGAARVDWSLTPEVDAMIIALGGNDLLRGIAPELSRANLQVILQAAEAREVEVLLIGLSAPGNYGPEYKQAFDAMYPELADAYGALYLESFFAGLDLEEDGAFRRYFQPDGIHPNRAGVERIVEGIGPMVLALIARVRDG